MLRQNCTLTATILNFKMATFFHVKPAKLDIIYNKLLLKASGGVYFNNKKNICNYLTSYVDEHTIQDGGHYIRWPSFLYINSSLLYESIT